MEPTIRDYEEADKILLDLAGSLEWDEKEGRIITGWEAREFLAVHVRRIKEQVNGTDNH